MRYRALSETQAILPGEPDPQSEAHRIRHVRAWRFQVGLCLATLLFGVLALLAWTFAYFPLDLELTRAIQQVEAPWLDLLFSAVTWIGFPPQSNVVFGAVIAVLFLARLRLEALLTLFAAAGSAGLWFAIAPLVQRPRPSPELVHVTMQLPAGSFPSGHVLNLTAIFGFLLYLAFMLMPPGALRRLTIALLALPLLVVGFARVQAGAHWPSDILGGYLLGGIWLLLTIHLYREAQQRRSPRHGRRAEVVRSSDPGGRLQKTRPSGGST